MQTRLSLLVLLTIFIVYSCKTRVTNSLSVLTTEGDTLFIYVSKEGKDEWSGQFNNPNRKRMDGPVATPQRAIEVATKARQDSITIPIVIQLSAGTYYLNSGLVIPEMVSGSESSLTIIRSAKNQLVSLVGGQVITDLRKSIDILGRIDSAYAKKITEIDATQLGINSLGSLEPRGFPRPQYLAPVEVFVNRKPLQIARWPNEGWAKINDVKKGRFGDQFSYAGSRPSRWLKEEKIWLHGFWARDWADSYVKVATIDTVANIIRTTEPHGTYGYVKGGRYCALNILEELDSPGEWYFSNEEGKIYLWLPKSENGTEIIVSLLSEPLLVLQNTVFVKVENLTLEMTRATGVKVNKGKHNTLENLQIRNTGNLGIQVMGGNQNTISNCKVYNTGEGGVHITGGNRDSLTVAGHLVYNSEIYNTNRWVKTYSPGIQAEGVGITVRNNYLHSIPHMAIRLLGNEHIIEYNEFAKIGEETGDAGAIYIGKDWAMRGNIIRNNYFHDINSKYHRGMMGVYLDDLASGTRIEGNIFENVQRGVVIGGGRDNIVKNNLFQSSRSSAVRIEYRQATAARAEAQLRKRLESVPYLSKIWQRKYPELVTVLQDDPLAPKNNIIEDNIIVNSKWLEIANQAKPLQKMDNNNIINDTNLRLDQAGELSNIADLMKGNSLVPLEKMGIQK
ncbi:MAG: right-handed parallel beta-helix repeat-containing protein [Bacteroidota bacterium]